jgi:hypothetical protein
MVIRVRPGFFVCKLKKLANGVKASQDGEDQGEGVSEDERVAAAEDVPPRGAKTGARENGAAKPGPGQRGPKPGSKRPAAEVEGASDIFHMPIAAPCLYLCTADMRGNRVASCTSAMAEAWKENMSHVLMSCICSSCSLYKLH